MKPQTTTDSQWNVALYSPESNTLAERLKYSFNLIEKKNFQSLSNLLRAEVVNSIVIYYSTQSEELISPIKILKNNFMTVPTIVILEEKKS